MKKGILILGYLHTFLNELLVAALSAQREVLELENILAVGPISREWSLSILMIKREWTLLILITWI